VPSPDGVLEYSAGRFFLATDVTLLATLPVGSSSGGFT